VTKFLRRSPSYVIGTLAAIFALCLGSYVRLVELGEDPLVTDELIHHFVAENMAAGSGAVLPSGASYTRGVEYSKAVQFAREWIEDPELAARLPSALLGVGGLFVIGGIGWWIGGPWVAAAAILMLGVYPSAVGEARRARFYTEQLLFLLVALAGALRIMAEAGSNRLRQAGLLRKWQWPMLVLTSIALASQIQITTVSIMPAAALIFLIAATLDVRNWGWPVAMRKSAALQLFAVGAACVLLVAIVFPARLADAFVSALDVPVWASGGWDIRAYYWSLSEAFPLLVTLSPLVYLVVLVRNWRLGTVLLLWFAVPLAIHSVLPLQNPRYVIGAVPALFIAGSVAAVHGLGALRESLAARIRVIEERPWRRWNHGIAGACVVLVAVFIMATSQSMQNALQISIADHRRVYRGSHAGENWGELATRLEWTRQAHPLPVGTVDGLASLLYGGAVDFVIQQDDLDVSRHVESRRPGQEHLVSLPLDHPSLQGLADYYSGRPVLTRSESIRKWFSNAEGVYIVIDESRWHSENQIDPWLKATLEREAYDLCEGRCGDLRLYRWLFDTPASSAKTRRPGGY